MPSFIVNATDHQIDGDAEPSLLGRSEAGMGHYRLVPVRHWRNFAQDWRNTDRSPPSFDGEAGADELQNLLGGE